MKTILTYGTFDLLHIGHVNMLERLKELGNKLIVGVSTDEFNLLKGKQCIYGYAERAKIVGALRCVDLVIPENDWTQKAVDIKQHDVDVFGIGADWEGKFDELQTLCEVIYLPRTPSISTTSLKKALSQIDSEAIQKIKQGLDGVLDIVKALE
ncbi:adenylyltransferase/cytidyltransferase family protein [Aliiglaciecola sp. 2_MG-2023]|uniref:adenylyltransferase/cytidyltransferase family protein n=1 Tax=unclassified Aliiglaciecola TaxID=2593648 RepID=UPI0026E31BA2|nr:MULTISPECIES: adenylyltransferase/cytidyltransferase family protein [unclassified Aliiglaciecola]MDO6709363.1 adenylyltransferase/cytidyltransferase family protein [Aliiglaciecola sp. 2_MG-2023]MDO6750511.1 adenylyltransferase/cytidyltransferase family protein [Aliiglaciecola sp. 1_MG-2023]